MEQKLIELQTQFSYQEDLLADLNEIVVKQQRQLDEVQRELAAVKEQLRDAIERGPGTGAIGDQEKPPHY